MNYQVAVKAETAVVKVELLARVEAELVTRSAMYICICIF